MSHIVDSYSESNYSGVSFAVYTDQPGAGQSFAGDGSVLDSVQFYVKKSGSPTGNVVAKIYAHSGTFGSSSVPSGAALAVSDNVDVSTLGTSFALQTFNFSGANRITLSSQYYIVTIEYTGGTFSNSVLVGADDTSPTHGGNSVENTTSHPGWFAISTEDICFYVNGIGSSPSASISPSASVSPSSSASPSPAPVATGGILRISKPGVNVLTNSDVQKMIFSSEYGTLKYFSKQTVQTSFDASSGDISCKGTYTHNLGYYPYVEVYVRVYTGSTPTGDYEYCPFFGSGASIAYSANVKLTTTDITVYGEISGVSSAVWHFDFIIFIFKNDLHLS